MALNATVDLDYLDKYLTPDEKIEFEKLIEAEQYADKFNWDKHCLPYQRMPAGDWNTWALICGRGAGKSRTVVENVRSLVQKGERKSIGILAPTEAIYRDVLVAQLQKNAPPDFVPRYLANEKKLIWPNKAVANLISGERPDAARGHNWDMLVADEVVAYRYPEAYYIAKAAVRLGDHPITLVATTPKSTPLIWKIVKDPNTVVVNASTFDNPHLPKSFLDDMRAQYYGTPSWDTEVLGILKPSIDGALWTSDDISANRVTDAPELSRIVVGIDPGGYSDNGDESGILVVGKGVDGLFYVLADYSLQGDPDTSARKMFEAYEHYAAGKMIYEANNGGSWIQSLIHTINPYVNVDKVHAYKGKLLRAEPYSAMYKQGKVKHVGEFPSLEKQMCEWTPGKGKSPDRLDALVFALTELSGRGREIKVY